MAATGPRAALRLWRTLAGRPDALAPGTRAVVRGTRGLCPPGWTGVLRLGDAVLVDPGEAAPGPVAALLALDDPTDPQQVAPLAHGELLGPGELSYLPDGAAPPAIDDPGIGVADDEELGRWLADRDPAEVDESDATVLDHRLVLRREGRLVAVGGWTVWPADAAHVGVLVDERARGTGAGRSIAAAVLHAAVAAGLAPQWRAASWNTGSRRLAATLGLVEVGRQLSVERLELAP